MATFYKADCLTHMKTMADKSIDFIYFNPPFATTFQPWDEKLPWEEIFQQCFRILKTRGTLAIHCSVPFNYTLIRLAPRAPNYSWYWDKKATTNPLLAKKQPLRCVEEILVWTTKKTKYNPQRIGTEKRIINHKTSGKTGYVMQNTLVPQEPKEVIGRYQTHLISMSRELRGFATRPEAMIELFIKSYTDENDIVFDPTCYKGLSGRIAIKLKRRWIGVDKNYFPEELISTKK